MIISNDNKIAPAIRVAIVELSDVEFSDVELFMVDLG